MRRIVLCLLTVSTFTLILSGCGNGGELRPTTAASGAIKITRAGDPDPLYFDTLDELSEWLRREPLGAVAIELAPGEYAASGTVQLHSMSQLSGAGVGLTRIVAATSLDAIIANTDQEAGNAAITVSDLSLDCAGRADDGVRTIRVSQLELNRLSVTGCNRTGVRVSGHGEITRGTVLDSLTLTQNGGDGLIVMWASRNVRYTNVFAHQNRGRGIVIDHSEATITNLISNENGGDGIFLRNLFAVSASNLVATRNGGHGILAQGFVGSAGTGWIAQANSRAQPGLFDEIHFSGGDDLSYGLTADSVLQGVVAGAYSNGTGAASARHGLYIAPAINSLYVQGAAFLDVGGAKSVPPVD